MTGEMRIVVGVHYSAGIDKDGKEQWEATPNEEFDVPKESLLIDRVAIAEFVKSWILTKIVEKR